jgi:hypothetical protein
MIASQPLSFDGRSSDVIHSSHRLDDNPSSQYKGMAYIGMGECFASYVVRKTHLDGLELTFAGVGFTITPILVYYRHI